MLSTNRPLEMDTLLTPCTSKAPPTLQMPKKAERVGAKKSLLTPRTRPYNDTYSLEHFLAHPVSQPFTM